MTQMTRREFNILVSTGLASLSLPSIPTFGNDHDARRDASFRIEKYHKGNLVIQVLNSDGKPIEGAQITVNMKRHSFGFGTAVAACYLAADTGDGRAYRRIVEENFNRAVFENDLKGREWEISKTNRDPQFRREWTECSLAWLAERNIRCRGHHIVNARFKAREYGQFAKDPEALRRRIFAHMEDVLNTLGTRIPEWDVINHLAVLKDTLETVYGGPEIYAEIIKAGRNLAPQAEMWVNEGTVLSLEERRDHYENMIRYLVDAGAGPDGIGLMGHFCTPNLAQAGDVYAVLDRFAGLLPRLQITELDIRTDGDEQLQADYLREVMTTAFSHPNMESITAWGFWEGRHPCPEAALFFKKDWSSKPAGEVWRDLVFNQWWTNEKGRSDSTGQFQARGFMGDHEITVTQAGQTKSMTALIGKEDSAVTIIL